MIVIIDTRLKRQYRYLPFARDIASALETMIARCVVMMVAHLPLRACWPGQLGRGLPSSSFRLHLVVGNGALLENVYNNSISAVHIWLWPLVSVERVEAKNWHC